MRFQLTRGPHACGRAERPLEDVDGEIRRGLRSRPELPEPPATPAPAPPTVGRLEHLVEEHRQAREVGLRREEPRGGLADLASGRWDRRHGHLRHEDSHDCGYRIAMAG